ncbi:hypothetical protein F5050DRAFT_1731409 [Lentinula boryana]|uniref:Secreted protein n=1 Tax=Lentinula boryana TaxID=40481 RepID=A0ABQ8QPK0_9AGAR|nr:hypothetical protein F5050DRAFT_1731409 [Lentinula boryana]
MAYCIALKMKLLASFLKREHVGILALLVLPTLSSTFHTIRSPTNYQRYAFSQASFTKPNSSECLSSIHTPRSNNYSFGSYLPSG